MKNDQRVLSRAKMGMKIALLEIRRVLDHERTEAVDLLSARPQPFIIMDRGLASSAVRFVTTLAWIYPLPHYHRLFGSAVLLPEHEGLDSREMLEEIVRHMGGPTDEAGIRQWLSEHLVRFQSALDALSLERRRLMFEGIDAMFGKAVYELKAPFAICRERLDELHEVDGDALNDDEEREGFADARVCLDRPDDQNPGPAT